MSDRAILPARLVIEALRLDRWSASRVEARASRALERGVGGFIIFGGDVEGVSSLTRRLASDAGRPLWFGADLERGVGQQLRGASELPPPAALAAHPEPEAAAQMAGATTGREALEVGFNWVIAPVLDLDVEPANPIVSTRSFGADPGRVAGLGLLWIRACQGAGALACAKHFPGHGRTRHDSHIGLPAVEADREALEADLAPFGAVTPEVATVMVAHVAFPALDCHGAATLSRSVVTGLLRERLGFQGPVATDAMIMGAIGEDDAGAAVEAVRAGCDLICYPSDAGATIAALERAAEEPATAARLKEAIVRAERALSRASPAPGPSVRGGAFDSVALASGTVVGDPGTLAGWDADLPTEVEAVSDDEPVGPPAGREGPLGSIVASELARLGWRVSAGGDASVRQRIVVLAATPQGWKGHGGPSPEAVDSVRTRVEAAGRGLVVLLGHARWLRDLGVPAICAWSTETVMERAAARWLNAAVAGSRPSRPGSER